MRNYGAASAEIELALVADVCAVFDAVVSLRKPREMSQRINVPRDEHPWRAFTLSAEVISRLERNRRTGRRECCQ